MGTDIPQLGLFTSCAGAGQHRPTKHSHPQNKVKQILRRAAPRTTTELIAAAKTALEALSMADCMGSF